jgi:ubiquinone/menaquinone biosynthesis C-methylase UbiE
MPNVFRRTPKTLPAQRAYDLWAASYNAESNPVRDLNNRTIESWLPSLSGRTVLDIGCGTGYFCECALNKGAKTIYGVDFSKEMVRLASERLTAHERVIIDKGSAEHLMFQNGTFDLIIASLVFGHVQHVARSFDEVARVLNPNGTFIFSDFHPDIARRGAKRTFKNPEDNRTYAIEHYIHSKERYFELLNERDFSVQRIAEPEWSGDPVVLIIEAIKIK